MTPGKEMPPSFQQSMHVGSSMQRKGGGGERGRTGAGAVKREEEVRERKGKVVCLMPVWIFGVRERRNIGFFHYPLRPQIQKGTKPFLDEFHARGRAQVNFIKQED